MSPKQYLVLSEASRNPKVLSAHREMLEAPQFEDGPCIEVWYEQNPNFFEASGEFAPGDTHGHLGSVKYRSDPFTLYGALQGEHYSPNGEARVVVCGAMREKPHTSMSIGDVLVVHLPDPDSDDPRTILRTEAWQVATTGWKDVTDQYERHYN